MPSRPNAIGVGPLSPGSATKTSLISLSAVPVHLRARDGERRAVVAERFRVAQEERLVLRELRMQRDIHVAVHGARKPDVPVENDAGPPATGFGSSLPSRITRNLPSRCVTSIVPSGKKRQRERIRQGFRQHRDANVLSFAGRIIEWPVAERFVGKPAWRHGNAHAERHLALGERQMASTRLRARKASSDDDTRALDMNGDPQVGSRSIGRLFVAPQAVRGGAPREIWIRFAATTAASRYDSRRLRRITRSLGGKMRQGFMVSLVAALALFAAVPLAVDGQTAPRRVGGHPNLNGIWQAMGSAHWNLEGHAASQLKDFWRLGAIGAVPAGQSVVKEGKIPYLPEALAQARRESRGLAEDRSRSRVLLAGHSARDLFAAPVSDRAG